MTRSTSQTCDRRRFFTHIGGTLLITTALMAPACNQNESPLKGENERLRKQVTKQESVVVSLQDGNKVMQQQIDLLNRELRDTKKETERADAERRGIAAMLGAKMEENKKLTAEVQRTAATKEQASQSLRVEDKGGQSEDFPRPLAIVFKAAEEALARNGYSIRVSVKTDQKAVYVTERKISAPASLEVPGFRNQYLLSLQTLPSNGTRLSIKAEFEKMAQGGKVLPAGPEEKAEIERRLINEISKALASPNKL